MLIWQELEDWLNRDDFMDFIGRCQIIGFSAVDTTLIRVSSGGFTGEKVFPVRDPK